MTRGRPDANALFKSLEKMKAAGQAKAAAAKKQQSPLALPRVSFCDIIECEDGR